MGVERVCASAQERAVPSCFTAYVRIAICHISQFLETPVCFARGRIHLGHDRCFPSLSVADGQQQGIIDRFSHHGACKLRSREKWVASIMFNNKLSRLQELAKEQREREANTRGKHTETR